MKTSSTQKQVIGKGNFIKYLNPSTLIQAKANRNRLEVSNIHCRSMQQLDFNVNGVSHSSTTKQNIKSNIHHLSLFSEKESRRAEEDGSKSKSLSKFISFFENSNLLNPSQLKKQNKDSKRNNYNGFSYDLKISGSSNAANNRKIVKKKDKQNINYQTLNSQRQLMTINPNKSTLIVRNQNSSSNNNTANQTQSILVCKMKELIEEQKRRQVKYCQKIDQLQTQNKQLVCEKSNITAQMQVLSKRLAHYQDKIKELQIKYKQIHEKNRHLASRENKSSHKENREQDMVVKSLKKVINEQLNKIIELERFKIENEYLKQKMNHEENDDQSELSFSNHEYSFQYENKQQKKSPSSVSSSFKPGSLSASDYANQNFRKSKPNQITNQIQPENQNRKHFQSFFHIQQSPISADDHLKRFFKIQENIKDQVRKNPTKKHDRKQGPNMMKIIEAESSFSREAIEQVNEENDESDVNGSKLHRNNNQIKKQKYDEQQEIREAQDSILQEVDQYLIKWRNKPSA